MKLKALGVQITGHGSAVSDLQVTNEELRLETAAWVQERLGIKERRHLKTDETLMSLVESASLKALAMANLAAHDLDGIVIATSTPDFINPSMAAILHGRLGAKSDCASFDLQAVCAGFVYALGMAASLIASGAGKNFLLIGADQFSKITNFDDRNCVFFGDAAGAMIIQATEGDSFLTVELNTEGIGWESFHTSSDSEGFKMNAGEVAKNANEKLPASISSISEFSGISTDEIKWFVTHQPSKPVLDSLEETLQIPPGRLLRNITYRGNTAGATIPLLFSEMDVLNLAKSGDYICFSAIGSGWVWGSAILKWE
ncbi:FabH 3-oxoacyl-[acyl-carrier-protein] [Candidatus Nanopelagicaceae bacterium]